MMTSRCLHKSEFDRITVCKILSSSIKLDTRDMWTKFSTCLAPEGFQLTNSQHSEDDAFYWDIYTLLTSWCSSKQKESTLDSLLGVLDRCELWEESDILRETFSLPPKDAKLPEAYVSSSEVLKEFGEHVSENCSVLVNSTKISNDLLEDLQETCRSENLELSLAAINESLDVPTKGYDFYSALRNNPKCLRHAILSLEKDGQYKPAWVLRRAFRKFDIVETVFKRIAYNPYDVDKIVSAAFTSESNKGFSKVFCMLFPEFGDFSPAMKSFLGIVPAFRFSGGSAKDKTVVEKIFKALDIAYSEVDGIFHFWIYLIKIYSILWSEYSQKEPPEIFKFMNEFPMQQTRVVILGQYPSPFCKPSGFAYHGCDSKSIAGILENLDFELALVDENLKIPDEKLQEYEANYVFDGWVEQGVLMLNVLLTSHNIWSEFTHFLIKCLSENCSNIVFIITGKLAANTIQLIDQDKHAVFEAYLPTRPKDFRWDENLPLINANFYLYQVSKKESSMIDWRRVSSNDKIDEERFSKYKDLFEKLLKDSNCSQMKNEKFKCVVSPENLKPTEGTARKLQIIQLPKIKNTTDPVLPRCLKIYKSDQEVIPLRHKTEGSQKAF